LIPAPSANEAPLRALRAMGGEVVPAYPEAGGIPASGLRRRPFADHLNHHGTRQRSVIFDEIHALARAAHEFAVLDGEVAVDAAQDTLEMVARVEAQAAVKIQRPVVPVARCAGRRVLGRQSLE